MKSFNDLNVGDIVRYNGSSDDTYAIIKLTNIYHSDSSIKGKILQISNIKHTKVGKHWSGSIVECYSLVSRKEVDYEIF